MREVLTVGSQLILYLASAENYVEVHWLENGKTKHSLLRSTLSEAEKELAKQSPAVRRCHNSYIVNLNRARSFSGNKAGYRIILDGTDFTVPISRKYEKDIFGYLRH